MNKKIKKQIIKIEKRLRLAISAIILTFLLLFTTFFYFDKALFFIPLLILLSYFLTYVCLIEKIKNIGWINLFLMPVLLTIAFYLFYFLFPSRWLTRLPFTLFYGVSIYAILICSNIFSIGIEKNLQLYRAAFSINFFYQTLISFLFFNIIFSLREYFYFNMILVGLISFALSFQFFWSVKLEKKLNKELLKFSFFVSLVLSELAVLVSFIPFKLTIISIFLTGSFYSLSGIIASYLDRKLFKETIREYVFVWIFIFIIFIFSISWF